MGGKSWSFVVWFNTVVVGFAGFSRNNYNGFRFWEGFWALCLTNGCFNGKSR
uniref:Uncharacterized protein n=1 Tax=Meloidogyne enterolobii TaxID=390850 RepID=A0A6V7XXD4_MELEN|nr:unnamed protein product [Meloidogyne enterolobii]